MSDRMDVFRSFVRSAAESVSRAVEKLRPLRSMSDTLRDLRHQRAIVRDEVLTGAVAHAHRVLAASVTARDGGIRADVSFTEGDPLQVTLVPLGARFAPHGAKEIVFRVEPEERAFHPHVADVTSAVAGAIAHALWRLGLPVNRSDLSGAIVEREGADRLRVDLRTVPAVRQAANRSSMRVLLDAIEVTGMRVEEGALRIDFALPELGF